MNSSTKCLLPIVGTIVLGAMMIVAQSTQERAHALPKFSREYHVPCKTCHVSPPELTKQGMAFQANYFNWPGGPPPNHPDKSLAADPVSIFVNSTYSDQEGGSMHDAQFDNMWLETADGFNTSAGGHGGGYWLEYELAEKDGTRPGDLGNVFVATPIAGARGQLAINVGQFGPFDYQYGDASYLSQSTIEAIDAGDNGISFDSPTPQVALQWYDNRGERTANGNYVNVGMPFGGELDANQDSRLYSAQGAYIHAFRRDGYTTNGLFAYRDGAASYEGLIVTRQPWTALRILGAGSTGTDSTGTAQRLSVQGDYNICPDLAFVGRYELVRGSDHDEYPVYSINWYPGGQRILRLTAETIQDSGNRNNTLYATLQY
jgi:hypothetical protein